MVRKREGRNEFKNSWKQTVKVPWKQHACFLIFVFVFLKEVNIEETLIILLKTWQNKCVNKTPFLLAFYYNTLKDFYGNSRLLQWEIPSIAENVNLPFSSGLAINRDSVQQNWYHLEAKSQIRELQQCRNT